MGAYERSDANIRSLVLSVIGLFVLLGASLAAMWAMFAYLNKQEVPGPPASPVVKDRPLPPTPRLQTTPYDDLTRMRAAEEEKLNSYGWVDRRNGIVRIPIERAIELTAERGLPARSQAGSDQAAKPAAERK